MKSVSIKVGLIGVMCAAVAAYCLAAPDDENVKAAQSTPKVETSSAPISITIEDESSTTGLKTKPQVEKIYEHRVEELEKNFKDVKNKTTDKDKLKLIVLAHDSVDCMNKSMSSFPLFVDVVEGSELKANALASIMEENCVTDVLVHVKRDLPNQLPQAEVVFKELGFEIPDLSGY
jgi:hypothetical protein